MKKYGIFLIGSLIVSTSISSFALANTEAEITNAYSAATDGNRRISDSTSKCEVIDSLSRDGTAIWTSNHNAFYAGRVSGDNPGAGTQLDQGGAQIALKAENTRFIAIHLPENLVKLPGAELSADEGGYDVAHNWRIYTPRVREEHDYEWHFLRNGSYFDERGKDFMTSIGGNVHGYPTDLLFQRHDGQRFDAYVHIQINTEAKSLNRSVGYSPGIGELYSSDITVHCF